MSRREREHWSESDDMGRVQRGMFGSVTAWVVGLVVLFALIGAATWGFRVLTSDARGRGDAVVRKNSAVNRIAASEGFEDRHQDILAADQRIDIFIGGTRTGVRQTNLDGAIAYCIKVRSEYNAQARKFTQTEWRSTDLPYQIDASAPETDCKPTDTETK